MTRYQFFGQTLEYVPQLYQERTLLWWLTDPLRTSGGCSIRDTMSLLVLMYEVLSLVHLDS